jgi:hypothetical protein
MHRACGLRMLPAKGGNDPLPLPLRLRLRWSFPPSECQEGNWARIEIDLHWISNGSTMDHDLRLQRTIHEVHPMQFDIRATNTVTTRPSRACITPGLQQDRSLALLYYFSHGYSSYPQRLRGGWTMAKPYQHRIGVRAEICFDLIFDICDPAPQQISQAVAEGSPTDRGRRRSFQGSKS